MDEQLIFHQIGRDAMYKTWHAALNNQIIYTYSTGGSIVFGDRIYPIQKGALCFISSQCYHYTMPDNPAVYERSKIIFPDSQLQALTGSLANKYYESLFASHFAIYALIPEKVQPEVERLYQEASQRARLGIHAGLYFTSCLLRLIAYLDLYTLESIPSPTDCTAKALEYINQHIFENITIDGICRELHMSKYYFCRRFKQSTGLTVMEYLLKTRLTHAKNMLVKETTSVGEISSTCGFSSASHFCRIFKENTGMTPLQYRKNGFSPDI